MDKFINLIIKFRWYIALIIPIITIIIGLQLKNITFESGYRIWFDKDSKILKNYDNFRSTFGNDQVITVSFKNDKGIFNKESLHVIKRITDKFWETKYISRVDSITNYQYIYSGTKHIDDVIIEDFIEEIDKLTIKQLEDKKRLILKEEAIVNRLISSDATTTTIVARLSPSASETPEFNLELKELTKAILQPEIQKYGYEFFLNGRPIVNSAFVEIATAEGILFTPLVLVLAMLIFLVIFKKFSIMLTSVVVVVLIIVIVLSVQIMLGYKINNFTVNMPVFITAIAIADAMHIFWIYTVARKEGMDNVQAIYKSIKQNFLPIFFTSLTTSIGFASLAISNIIPIKTLGIATATAALLAFILTIVFITAILAIINPKIEKVKKEKNRINNFAKWYGSFIIRFDKQILISTLFIFIILGFGITKVKVDSNTVRYFNENTDLRKAVNFVESNMGGPVSYEIIIDSQKKDGIKDPKFLTKVNNFYEMFYKTFPDEVRHISSLLQIVQKINYVMNHSKTIPNKQELIAQYLLLYTLSLPQGMEINDQIDINERMLRITASMNVTETSKDLKMIAWIENWWKNNSEYKAQVNGQTAMFANLAQDLTQTLFFSIMLAIIAVSLIMLLIFKNIRFLPLYILPNIIPIVLVVGIMGWLNIDIDIGVAIAGAIIIGIAVDDSIHFFVKYFEALKKGYNVQDSLTYVMKYAGYAIILTTIILSLAFSVFLFSDFLPNYMFGVITASALIIAIIADLLMLPAILSLIDKYKKKI